MSSPGQEGKTTRSHLISPLCTVALEFLQSRLTAIAQGSHNLVLKGNVCYGECGPLVGLLNGCIKMTVMLSVRAEMAPRIEHLSKCFRIAMSFERILEQSYAMLFRVGIAHIKMRGG